MRDLSSDLPARDAFDAPLVAGAAPQDLPMWSDDDMMDIMPVRASATPDAEQAYDDHRSPGGEGGRGSERRDGEVPAASREAAARALEGLAGKVRGGELVLPGYASEMGDAAALAAALAALLGVRH